MFKNTALAVVASTFNPSPTNGTAIDARTQEKLMGIRKFSGALVIGAVFGGLLATTPVQANLITNGGFEDVTTFTPDGNVVNGVVQFVGDKSGTRSSNNGVDVPLAGWTTHTGGDYQRGIILFKDGYGTNTAAGGTYAIQLENSGDTISQHVATVAGHQYQLSYDLSAFGAANETNWTGWLQIRFDNVVQQGAYSPVVSNSDWEHQVYDFTATTNGMNLLFWSLGQYPQMDNISLIDVTPQAVPEPGSLALFGVAFAGLLAVGRRRKA